MKSILAIDGKSSQTVADRHPLSSELIMPVLRPGVNHTAKSNGDGTGYWLDNSAVIAAQSEQSEMISELSWVDIQLRYHSTNDVKRSISTVELLNAYAIECRDYVHNTADGLVVAGDKPVRPK